MAETNTKEDIQPENNVSPKSNTKEDIQPENIVSPKDIQGHPVLNENLSDYTTFHGYNVSYRETDLEGLQVVRTEYGNKSISLGTVVKDIANGHVDVQWVQDTTKQIETYKNTELLLFSNAHKGVPHAAVRCYGCTNYPLKGIRWQCLICPGLDLCTMCYMDNKHNLDHSFKRIVNTNSEGEHMIPRNSIKKDTVVSMQHNEIPVVATQTGVNGPLDLRPGEPCSFYPEQLPTLEQGSNGCFKFENGDDESEKQMIKVFIWRPIHDQKQKRELAYKPSLYLIFDSPEEALNDDIIDFAKKTKLPCHIVKQRVLFHSGSSKAASIHCQTDKETVKHLIGKGFHEFERMNQKAEEDDILYFKRMAECAIGKEVLPVIISLRKNGKIPQEVLNRATESQIPIIHFENKNMKKDEVISVLWLSEGDGKCSSRFMEYKAVTELPWDIQKLEKNYTKTQEWSDGIARMSNIGDKVDNLICNMIVGVCFEDASSTVGYFGTYHTASSMYLLKNGDSKMYEHYMNKPLDERYLECINEEVREQIPDLPEHRARTKEVIKRDFECYGLIFAALLQQKYWDGALQLLEAGYIGIHHVLVGCVELEDEINNGKTEKLMKEKLKRLEKALTDKAISITSHIFEADKQNKREKDEYRNSANQSCTGEYEDGKLSHAGRLLLNHGYLRDAINTKNNAYLESDTVKKILRKTFYGTEAVHRQTTLCFGILTAVHMIVLPSLMINMETRPLRWFYEKYKLHYMKVYIHMLGFLALLIAYSNMLLFDYRPKGITYTDYFIILWMASFFVDETNQIIVAVIRGKWKSYSIDWWNLLDWLMIALYTTGMLLKTGEGSGFQMISKLFLIVTFTALCTRLLHLTCMTEFLGRKLVINRKMIKDTSAFMIIITIIMLWYSVSFYALLYPNSDFSWKQIEKILRNGYWMLFGDLNIDATDLECTHNKTMYDRGILQRCPSDLGVYVTPYLKAFYGLLAVVLLLNLLIAMYSDTYTKVQQNANLSWLEMQIDLFEEYRIKTVFPIHLQLLALPGSMLAVLWYCFSYLRKKLKKKREKPRVFNDQPFFVRDDYDKADQYCKKVEVTSNVESDIEQEVEQGRVINKPDRLISDDSDGNNREESGQEPRKKLPAAPKAPTFIPNRDESRTQNSSPTPRPDQSSLISPNRDVSRGHNSSSSCRPDQSRLISPNRDNSSPTCRPDQSLVVTPNRDVSKRPDSTYRPVPSTSGRSRQDSSCNCQTVIVQKLRTLEDGIKEIKTAIAQLAATGNGGVVATNIVEDVIQHPINYIHEMRDLADKMKDDHFKNKLVQYLVSQGGHSRSDCIRRMMKKCGTNLLWAKYSLKGQKGKEAFTGHPLCRIIMIFLYDANYDIKPKSTYIAEENAVRKSEGKIDLSDSDAITTMNKLEKIEDMTKTLMNKQEIMEKMLADLIKIKNSNKVTNEEQTDTV